EYDTQELRDFCHIIGSFFDYMLIIAKNIHFEAFTSLGEGESYPIDFYKRYLDSIGVEITDFFEFGSWYEWMLGISNEISYMESLEKIKRIILSTLTSNSMMLLKSKGTLNSLIAAMRNFGVAEDILSIKKYNRMKYIDTESIIKEDRYFRKRAICFSKASDITVSNYQGAGNHKNFLGHVDSPYPSHYPHLWLCEIFTETVFPNVETTTIFGAKDIISQNDFFNVYLRNEDDKKNKVRIYLDFPLLGVNTELETNEIYNFYEGGRYIVGLQIGSENFEYISQSSDWNEYFLEFFVYKVGEKQITKVISNKHSVSFFDIFNLYVGTNIIFYCGANRDFDSGELKGPVINFCTVDISDFRYMTFVYNEEVLKNIYFGEMGVSSPFVFQQGRSSHQSRHFSNVFVWNFNYMLEKKDFYHSIVKNDIIFKNTDSFMKAINSTFPYSVYPMSYSFEEMIHDRYCSGYKTNVGEDHVFSFEKKHFHSFEKNKFYKSSKDYSFEYNVEKSLAKLINSEFFSWFVDLSQYYSYFNCHEERYSYEYKVLPLLKEQFMLMMEEKGLDFNLFFEYYKWIDDSIHNFLISFLSYTKKGGIFSVIENAVYDREKIPQKRMMQNVSTEEGIPYGEIRDAAVVSAGGFSYENIVGRVVFDLENSYKRFNYEMINMNGRASNNKFLINFPNYTKQYYKIPPYYPRVFQDLMYSPINYEKCYRNFIAELERKRGDSVFVNVSNSGMDESLSSRVSSEKHLEFSSSSCIVFRYIKEKKSINYIWGGVSI
ncbi:MAG: hypothetical protein N3A54_06510, partial [Patescibacteria group bacterium]|nr:hypothetical protein [Patescibacteria group bacterium]